MCLLFLYKLSYSRTYRKLSKLFLTRFTCIAIYFPAALTRLTSEARRIVLHYFSDIFQEFPTYYTMYLKPLERSYKHFFYVIVTFSTLCRETTWVTDATKLDINSKASFSQSLATQIVSGGSWAKNACNVCLLKKALLLSTLCQKFIFCQKIHFWFVYESKSGFLTEPLKIDLLSRLGIIRWVEFYRFNSKYRIYWN